MLARTPDFAVTAVLTRRPVALSAPHFPDGVLTNSRDALIERADIVFECSGDTAARRRGALSPPARPGGISSP